MTRRETAIPSLNDAPKPVLEGRGLSMAFGPVEVLHTVDIDVIPGEVHAILGENGAGKSTLLKLVGGFHTPTAGEILLDGKPIHFRDSTAAEAAGIVMIHQELSLVPDLTVEENVFLGHERHRFGIVDRRAHRQATRDLLATLRTNVDVTRRVRQLAVSQAQMVEIAKAVSRDVRVLCMDEPTDVLTGRETEVLFELVRRLTDDGVAILYVSHKLEEIKRIADRVTILRDGDKIGTFAADDLTLTLHRGEILGLARLVGAGRTELFEGVIGLRGAHGHVRKDGRAVHWRLVNS